MSDKSGSSILSYVYIYVYIALLGIYFELKYAEHIYMYRLSLKIMR